MKQMWIRNILFFITLLFANTANSQTKNELSNMIGTYIPNAYGNFDRLTSSSTVYIFNIADYGIHIVGSVAQSVTLPNPTSCKNKRIIIVNHSALAATLNFAYRTARSTTTTSIASNSEVTIASDGVEWVYLSN
jgi:hypothetical protein